MPCHKVNHDKKGWKSSPCRGTEHSIPQGLFPHITPFLILSRVVMSTHQEAIACFCCRWDCRYFSLLIFGTGRRVRCRQQCISFSVASTPYSSSSSKIWIKATTAAFVIANLRIRDYLRWRLDFQWCLAMPSMRSKHHRDDDDQQWQKAAQRQQHQQWRWKSFLPLFMNPWWYWNVVGYVLCTNFIDLGLFDKEMGCSRGDAWYGSRKSRIKS